MKESFQLPMPGDPTTELKALPCPVASDCERLREISDWYDRPRDMEGGR